MRNLLLVGLALVSLASASSEAKIGYHASVGIPEAERIKAEEAKIFANGPEAERDQEDDLRIVGGAIAPNNAHPYLAGLFITLIDSRNSVCGASLVSSSRLVTAAHCWFDGNMQAGQFLVVLGSQFLLSGGTRVFTTNVVMHPDWNPSTLENNVAVIILPTNVIFSQSIQPVALPSGTQLDSNFAGLWGMAAGYGKINDQQSGVPIAAQVSHVNLQVITVAACQADFGSFVQDSNICTSGSGGIGICGGDTGGPLVVNENGQNILVGIGSFVAAAGCQLGFPSVFSRVTSFYSFIIQHL